MFYAFLILKIVHISETTCPIEMGFGSKCSILNGQVNYIEKSKLNIADMRLIHLYNVKFLTWVVPPCTGPAASLKWPININSTHIAFILTIHIKQFFSKIQYNLKSTCTISYIISYIILNFISISFTSKQKPKNTHMILRT